MKLLLDENLSWRLVSLLKPLFSEITHVTQAGLTGPASDTNIWMYAREHNYTIVTNDEDFYLLAIGKGFPPKIVLLKTGNQSTRYIAALLSKHQAEIAEFIENREYGVLEIY